MNPHRDIESLLHSLKPGDLPADLRDRLRPEPPQLRSPRRAAFRGLAASGLLLAAAACLTLWFKTAETGRGRTAPVTVHHLDSELVASRTLGFIEKDGRVYQIEERRWRDAEAAFCSATPVSVSIAADRRELVYEPVSFD
jgi:hypothetical protein